MKRALPGILSLAMLFSAGTALADPAACKPGTTSLPAGYEGWSHPTPLTAATNQAGLSNGYLTLNHAATVHLDHTPDVHFLQRPAEPGGSVSYGGMIAFEAPKGGTYRIMLPNKTWIDVLGQGGPATSTHHQHGPDCSGIRKMVDFQLSAGKYTVQLAGSGLQDMPVMVSALP
ncbi:MULTISPECIES: hypothetical protein [unclassified Gluconobacter]|uniref:hypothetical protein n=1 Tax=unclassified Gluconobacter TaxID=2644261 RepID=UPI0017712D59|nr:MULTISPECIES: hypothetical protein [unclassified Gluconobacter]GFE97053.1 hypothetical protein DmGdi_21260 [Gluconobacter sp. Gdi]